MKAGDQLDGCYNYRTHNESWRNINSIGGAQPNTTSCDAERLKDGWHRFIGGAGSVLYGNNCVNGTRCGTRSPGWLIGSHPTISGAKTNATLHFNSFYCADDFGLVDIRNCGNFFTYRFIKFPYWSCDYGVCTN